MRSILDSYKPAAPRCAHLLLASLLWTVVGGLLAFFGVRWIWASHLPNVPLLLGGAVAVGLLKEHFVLRRAAERTIERIIARGDGRCLGGFLSLRSWGFVILMVAAGRLLRGSPMPRVVVGVVYLAVGTALFVGARRLWFAWYRLNCGS